MEKMNTDCGLPAMQVLKFDGLPESYPVFHLSFHQMVDSRALDEPMKMAHLIQLIIIFIEEINFTDKWFTKESSKDKKNKKEK